MLGLARGGDARASARLYDTLYGALHERAKRLMRSQGPAATLQATALVHEAWLKLANSGGACWNDRRHFLKVAARAMRQVLVDHARAKKTEKRGGGRTRVEFDALFELFEERASDLVGLDEALERLADFDPELARVVDLRFFAGLSIEECAEVMRCSHATVERSWRTARTWLRSELTRHDDGP